MDDVSRPLQGLPRGDRTELLSEPAMELSIGDLATATGVGAATLRAWERRHGFPLPSRRPSGHRRYDESQVALVLDVVRRQQEGVRLEAAIAGALTDGTAPEGSRPVVPGERSVFAALRRRHPQLTPQRLGKPMLLALSWAIEDEFCSRALAPHLFGSFQHDSYFRAARRRWDDLAVGARTAAVFADFTDGSGATEAPAPAAGPARVHLDAGAPLRREWAVICDDDDLPAVLTAWELPGQQHVREADRLFDAVWTVERRAARDAARACARAAYDAGALWAPDLLDRLAPDPRAGQVDAATQTALFNRVVAYVDRQVRHRV